MPSLILADRVKVRSRTVGTNNFLLENVVSGFRDFSAIGNENETFYGAIDSAGNWEIGRGTYTEEINGDKILSRDQILSSSNNNNKVSFPSGSKNVFSTFPASLAQVNREGGIGNFIFVGEDIDTTNSNPIFIRQDTTVAGNLTVNGTLNYSNTLASAATLATPRTINGVSFNGSENITITASGSTLTGTSLSPSINTVGTITTGTWSASFGNVSGATLTNLTAGNLQGTIPSGVLFNSIVHVGNTAIRLNRNPGPQTLTGTSIDGNAETATALQTPRQVNGVFFDGTTNITISASAETLTGTFINPVVAGSNLTSLGTLTDLEVNNTVKRIVPFQARKNSTLQIISPSVDNRMVFDTVVEEVDDVGLTYNSTSNPGRFQNTSGRTQVYLVSTTINFNFALAGSRAVWISKNGAIVSYNTQPPASNGNTFINISVSMVLANLDYFEIFTSHTAGGNLNTGQGNGLDGNYVSITQV